MTAFLYFLVILFASAAALIMYTVWKTGSLVGAIDYYARTGVYKHWFLALILGCIGAGLSQTAKAAEWFEYTDVFIGLEAPWAGHNLSCKPGAEPDNLLGSNLGLAQHIVTPTPGIDVSAQWTHHSCAIGADAPVYDAVGISVRWRIDY